jgi:predicted AAA+ superfamily ATPase
VEYVPRLVDAMVAGQIEAAGAVLVRGPKGCGKTETGRRHSRSELAVEDTPSLRAAMAAEPRLLLQGDTPRLIDEWQIQPGLWNAVRREVDRRRAKGQFILTGSSTPREQADESRHSGVGRFGLVDMRTMSWRELGWSDASHAWGARRDPAKVRRALESLARNVATEVSAKALARDAGGADGPLADQTIAEYLEAFHALMVVEDLPAWNTHIRSSARLRKRPKRHLADPSLCCAALGLTPPQLLADLEYTGLLFESAAVHDLRVYAAAGRGRVSHYRDSNGLEVDAVVEFPGSAWAAFEVRLGFGAADQAAESLKRFAANIDQTRMGAPSALVVITGSGLAHTRPDGVHVAPLGCLG